MDIKILIVIIIVIIIVLFNLILIKKILNYSKQVKEAFKELDEYFIKRFDLMNNFVAITRQYIKIDAINEIEKLRSFDYSKMNINRKININIQLKNRINEILENANLYQELKSSSGYLKIEDDLNMVEEDISNYKNNYNESSIKYNELINKFPYIVVSKIFRFKDYSLYDYKKEDSSII